VSGKSGEAQKGEYGRLENPIGLHAARSNDTKRQAPSLACRRP
jgi:hypothetical protein